MPASVVLGAPVKVWRVAGEGEVVAVGLAPTAPTDDDDKADDGGDEGRVVVIVSGACLVGRA